MIKYSAYGIRKDSKMFKSIQTKFLTYNLILIALIVVIGAGIFYSLEADHLIHIEKQHSLEENIVYSKNIGLLLDKHITILQTLANNRSFNTFITPTSTELLNKLRHSPYYKFVNTIFITPEGEFIDPDGKRGSITDREYYHELIALTPDYILSEPIMGRTTEQPVVLIVVPIIDTNGRFIGGIAGIITLDTISKEIAATKHTGESYGWIIDQTGLVIAHPLSSTIMNRNIKHADKLGFVGLSAIGEEMFLGDTGIGEYHDANEDLDKFLTYSIIPNTPGWRLAITTLNKEIIKPTQVLLRGILFTSFVFLLITVFITTMYSTRMVKPIVDLTDAVKHSENMDFKVLEYGSKDDEIGHLVDAYNKMTYAVKHHTENLEAIVSSRTAALNKANIQLEQRNLQLTELATKDHLTGLINRTQLYHEIEHLMNRVGLHELDCFSLLFIDLDNFKYYNDIFGHDVGDKLLLEVSQFIETNIHDEDILCRHGGDEFILLLPNTSLQDAEAKASALSKLIADREGYYRELKQFANIPIWNLVPEKYIGLSAGCSYYSNDSRLPVDQLIKKADINMYAIKRQRKALE